MTRTTTMLATVGLMGALALAGLVLPFDQYVMLVIVSVVMLVGPLALAANLRSSEWGLNLLIVVACLVPLERASDALQSGSGGKLNVTFLLAAFLCAMWFLRLVVLRRSLSLSSYRIVAATVIFIAVAVLSFVVGQFPWFPVDPAPMRAQIGGLGLFILSGGIFLVVGHEVRSLTQLQRLTWMFIGTGGLAVIVMLSPLSHITIGPIAVLTPDSVGSLFFTWLVAMSASQALCNRRLSPSKRMILLGAVALVLGRGLLVTRAWASGWGPPLVALGTVLLLRFPRLTLGGGLLLLAPALLLSDLAWNSVMKEESWSWMTRVEAFRIMGYVIERNPLLGLGPANYHYYTPLFPILGYRAQFNSHNNYVDLVAQVGVIGLAAFCWIAVEAVRVAVNMRERLTDSFARAYVVGVLGGLAGSLAAGLLADWIVPFIYNIGVPGFRSSVLFWIFLGGLLALKRMTDAVTVPVRTRRHDRIRQLVPNRV